MRAVVAPDVCIGCELCQQVCPDVYRMEGDKAIAHVDPLPANLEQCARDGALQCPVTAIQIIED